MGGDIKREYEPGIKREYEPKKDLVRIEDEEKMNDLFAVGYAIQAHRTKVKCLKCGWENICFVPPEKCPRCDGRLYVEK